MQTDRALLATLSTMECTPKLRHKNKRQFSRRERSRELGVPASLFHKWCGHFRRGGPQALRPACRPRKGFGASDLEPEDLVRARKRISELERKVGQQQVELDFFQQALRRVRGARQPNDGPGERTSTRSSRR